LNKHRDCLNAKVLQASTSDVYGDPAVPRSMIKKCDPCTRLDPYLPRSVSLHYRPHFDNEFDVLRHPATYCWSCLAR